MGLFGIGKKKYQKNVTKDKEALADDVLRVNRLLIFAEGNETVTAALHKLQDDLHYTSGTGNTDARKSRKELDRLLQELDDTISKPTWDQENVLYQIKLIEAEIITHTRSVAGR